MSPAARLDKMGNASHPKHAPLPVQLGAHRYLVLSTLCRGPRAEVSVCVPETATSLDELLVVKRFDPEAAVAEWTRLVAELELMKQLQHEHVLRTLDVGLQPASCYWVSEYLEGTTLRAALDCAAAQGVRLPTPIIARVLLALLEAVMHAEAEAPSERALALVRGPVTAEDVFLTQDGQVKLLGFKQASPPRSGSAIDALFEQQWTPELGSMLEHLPCRADLSAREWSESVVSSLKRWHSERLGSDGRAELARWLRTVHRNERAGQAMQLVSEFSRLRGGRLKFRSGGEPEEAPAQSGYRRIGALVAPSAEPPAPRLARSAGATSDPSVSDLLAPESLERPLIVSTATDEVATGEQGPSATRIR